MIRASLLKGPRHGSLTLKRDGSFAYQPDAGYSGRDAFEYRVIDEHGGVAVGRAVVRVAPLDPFTGQGPRLGEVTTRDVPAGRPASNDGVRPPASNPPASAPAAVGPALSPASSSNTYADVLRQLGLLGD
jgi:hypothetical protein